MRYQKILDPSQIFQAQAQSHAFWGGTSLLEARYQNLLSRIREFGGNKLFLSGLIDGKGEVAVSLKRYYLPLTVGGREILSFGLGAYFKNEKYKATPGLAKNLLDATLRDAREEDGCGASHLFSDIGTTYYEGFGYRNVSSQRWKVLTAQLPNEGGLRVRAANPTDLPELIAWYDRTSGTAALRTVRDATTWTTMRTINHVQTDLILSRGSEDIGYLSLTYPDQRNYLWVEEWSAPAEYETDVWATVRKLAEEVRREEVAGWQLPGYQKLAVAEISAREKQRTMVKLFDGSELPEGPTYFAPPDHF